MTDPLNPTPEPQPQPGGSQVPPPGATATTTASDMPLEPTKDERTMGMLAHLLGILSVLGPLIIWLIKKDESKFVDDQGKESLNFQITLLIPFVGLMILSAIPIVGCFTVLLIPVVWIGALVFLVMAAVKANEGVRYRYPVNLRVIK